MRPWLISVWIVGLLLAAAASWLFWSVMPLVGRSGVGPDGRFLISLLPLVLWALVPIVFWQSFSRRSAQAITASIHEQRRTAIAFLSDRGIKGSRARYSLPFFLVVGPPGSGKTSLIERSDMKLGMPMQIGNATWWVGADAVFIETSLGLPDAPARDVFELLHILRPKLPVNATLLVVSPADLTLADHTEQQMVTQAVADGLRSLDDVTSAAVPTYLLLSKTDLVPGFREFFDRYEPQEREQPWGFLLSYETMSSARTAEERQHEVENGFRDVLEAMRVRHMEWLSRESDPLRCGHIQSFAAQIAVIRTTIAPLLERLTPENDRIWNGALLRAIFLTSARQEPLAIDALLPEMSRRFAMPRIGMLPPDLGLDEEDHGYFIGGILKKVVLPESGLVWRGLRRGRTSPAQWALIAAVLLGTVGTAWWIFTTFDREVKFAGRVYDQASHLRPAADPARASDLASLLQSLTGLQKIRGEVGDPAATYRHALGLSARPGLADTLDRAGRDMRARALTLHLASRLEAGLVDMDADVGTLRQRLQAAMAASDGTSPLLLAWLAEEAESLPEDQAAALMKQGADAISETGGLPVSADYIDAARRIIAYKDSLT